MKVKYKAKVQITKDYELVIEADSYEQAHQIVDNTPISEWKLSDERVWLQESPVKIEEEKANA